MNDIQIEITHTGRTCLATLKFNKNTYNFTAKPNINAGNPMLLSVADIVKLGLGKKQVSDAELIDHFREFIPYSLLKLADV
jgi:hypothetical protein